MHIGVDLRLQIQGDISDLEFLGERKGAAAGYIGIVENACHRPTRLLWSGREAAKETGNPETHTAFIGERNLRDRDNRRKGDCTPKQT